MAGLYLAALLIAAPGNVTPPLNDVKRPLQARCGPNRYRDDSERCAAWKSADAADRAAWWAVAQTVLSVVGVIGLIVSLYYTRRAIRSAEDAEKDTEKALALAALNANAVIEANAIARQSMEGQLRPWVFVAEVQFVAEHMQKMNANIVFKNYGNWPAVMFVKGFMASSEPYPFSANPLSPPDTSLATTLPPGETETAFIQDVPMINRGRGYKTRIDISLSYQLPTGNNVTVHETYVGEIENGRLTARKMIGYDSANHPSNVKPREDRS